MTRTVPAPEAPDDAALALRPDLTDDELNELFDAAWPGHRLTAAGVMPLDGS